MRKTYYDIVWAKRFESTRAMLDKMQNPRRPMSENTTKQYAHAAKLFMFYSKTENPNDALKIARSDVYGQTDKFIDYLMKDRKLASKTVHLMFHGLKFWFESNDINVDALKKVVLPSSTDVKIEDRKPTVQELMTVMAFANVRDIALIETAVSSGLRVNTLADLRIKDIIWNPHKTLGENVSEETSPTMLTVDVRMGRKTTKKFFTFITPQAKTSLRRYHEWRKRQGENLTENSNIFGSVYTPDAKNTGPSAPFGEAVSSATLAASWDRLLEKAGLDKKSHKWNELHFHTLRKFFKSECINAGCKNQYIEFWMGHKGGYLDDSYFRGNLKEHLAEYERAIPNLTISTETNVLSKDVDGLKRNGEAKDKKIDDLTSTLKAQDGLARLQQERIQTLESEIAGIKRNINEYAKQVINFKKDVKEGKFDRDSKNEDCQRIVDESELKDLLVNGWHIVATLPSGKIVVTNE